MTPDGLEILDGLGAGLYIWGEVHRVWDRTNKSTGDVKYYARFLIDDEPGTIQVNITALSPADIRYLVKHQRESVLLRVRYFLMDGNVYFRAEELVTGAAASSGGGLAALMADEVSDGGKP